MKNIHLNELPLNCRGKVEKLNCDGNVRRRLLDLGIVKGTNIVPVLKSPLGDPIAFEIRGSIVALRDEISKLIDIYVEK
jgi:ferrous iron transport protein A